MEMNAVQTRIYQRRWWTLLTITISVIIVVLDSSIVNIALPTFQRELNATISDLQWIISAYTMVFAGIMLTTGALGDRFGRARMLQAGMIIFAGASLGAAFSGTATVLIIWRVIMGLGAAMMLPSTLAIITNVFPKAEMGKAVGVWAGVNALGVALGPIIGGLIIDNLDWHWLFYVNLPIIAVALALGFFLVPNSRDPDPKRLDIPGTLLSIAGLSTLVFGLIQSYNWGWGDPWVIVSLCGAAVLITFFILWESHTDHPMLEISLFRRRRFSGGVGAVSLMALALFGLSFTNTLYMQFVKDYTALQTGIRYLPLAMGVLLGAGSSDRLVQRLGTTRVMVIGLTGTAVLSILYSFWNIETPYWQIGLIYGFLGFSLGYITAPAATAIMGALPDARAGVGSAMNSVTRMVAGTIAVAVFGTLVSNIYASSFKEAIAAVPNVPANIVATASDSVGAAVTIAGQIPAPAGDMLAEIARSSFMDGWQVMAFITAGICAIGIFFVMKFMPPKSEE